MEYYRELGELVRGAGAKVVGHVDLVRLYSGEEGRDVREWGEVWREVKGVLGAVKEGGGWLECNTSGLRKGLGEPYPGRVIAEVGSFLSPSSLQLWFLLLSSFLDGGLRERGGEERGQHGADNHKQEWIRMGGKFTFSDDSHGVAQVGTNYLRGLDYLEGLGVKELWTLERVESADDDDGKGELREKAVTIAEFRASLRLD